MATKRENAAWSPLLLVPAILCGAGICFLGLIGVVFYPLKDRIYGKTYR